MKIMFEDCHIYGSRIDRDFPKDRLLEIMRPYIQLYYQAKYSMLHSKKIEYTNKLKAKLREFMEFNPQFGRKKVIMKPVKLSLKKISDKIVFDDKHIPFYENVSVNDFMKSHLLNTPTEYVEININNTTHDDDDTQTEDDDENDDDTLTEYDDDDDDDDDDDEQVIIHV
jgi:hypothetical protein